MNIWEWDKLLLFLLFFMPGFISLKIYDLLIASERRDFSKAWFEAAAYSAINYAVLFPLFPYLNDNWHSLLPWLQYMIGVITLFLMPIAWPCLIARLLKCNAMAPYVIHPDAKPWDYIFSQKQTFYIIAHLKDGRRISGFYGGQSFASSYPAEEQIYIEQTYVLNDDAHFEHPVGRTKGVIIYGREIVALEFFEKEDKPNESNKNQPATPE